MKRPRIGGNRLPKAPHFTMSLATQYSMPIRGDWIATARDDFYWAGNPYARVR